VYLLAPPEKAQALDRFFVNTPLPRGADPRLAGDFFVSAEVTLGAVAETYDLQVAPEDAAMSLADDFTAHLKRPAKKGDTLPLGSIFLIAHEVVDGRVTQVGLRLAEPDAPPAPGRAKGLLNRLRKFFG
jgi:cell volume regulation protein A